MSGCLIPGAHRRSSAVASLALRAPHSAFPRTSSVHSSICRILISSDRCILHLSQFLDLLPEVAAQFGGSAQVNAMADNIRKLPLHSCQPQEPGFSALTKLNQDIEVAAGPKC